MNKYLAKPCLHMFLLRAQTFRGNRNGPRRPATRLQAKSLYSSWNSEICIAVTRRSFGAIRLYTLLLQVGEPDGWPHYGYTLSAYVPLA